MAHRGSPPLRPWIRAVPLAFGSIAGSGILSLPSSVYTEAGSASVLVWVIAAAACLPMLLMFRDAMLLSGEGNAVQQLVTWFLQHGITNIERIITENGSCYRSAAFADALNGAEHRRTRPCTPKHNGKVERYNLILAEKFPYARTWTSEIQRESALETWNLHCNYHRPHGAHRGKPPASATPARVNNVMVSYN